MNLVGPFQLQISSMVCESVWESGQWGKISFGSWMHTWCAGIYIYTILNNFHRHVNNVSIWLIKVVSSSE